MDRRMFVKTGAWVTAAGWLPSWFADALEKPGGMAIYDASLAESRAFAELAARSGMRLFDIDGDIGVFWHTTLALRLARSNALLAGVIRASDFFVLKRLAANANRPVLFAERHGAGGSAVVFSASAAGSRVRLIDETAYMKQTQQAVERTIIS